MHFDFTLVGRPFTARGFFTVLKADLSAACVDGVVPFSSDARSSGRLPRRYLFAMDQFVTAADDVLSLSLQLLELKVPQRPLECAQWTSGFRHYAAGRAGEDLSKKVINRCLKRYIVRELCPAIAADLKKLYILCLTLVRQRGGRVIFLVA